MVVEPSSVRVAPKDESASPSDAAAARARRRLPPGIVPALLRTRPVAAGEWFSVHGRTFAATGIRGVLIVAVPKRVMRRAVDRNAMRRVAREAWRAAGLDRSPIVAMLRMKRVPQVDGQRERKRVARCELDRLFALLRRRVADASG